MFLRCFNLYLLFISSISVVISFFNVAWFLLCVNIYKFLSRLYVYPCAGSERQIHSTKLESIVSSICLLLLLLGHDRVRPRKNCKNEKVMWIHYVERFMSNNDSLREEWYGKWCYLR